MIPIPNPHKKGEDAALLNCEKHGLPAGQEQWTFVTIKEVDGVNVRVETPDGQVLDLLTCQVDAGRCYDVDGKIQEEWQNNIVHKVWEVAVQKKLDKSSDAGDWEEWFGRAELWKVHKLSKPVHAGV